LDLKGKIIGNSATTQMTALMFAFKPTKGVAAVQDDPKEPYLLTAGAETGSKGLHYKVGGGQHGTEATKAALKEKKYLRQEGHLKFVQTEIYAMGFLEQFLQLRVI
jgi:hypothetical protein